MTAKANLATRPGSTSFADRHIGPRPERRGSHAQAVGLRKHRRSGGRCGTRRHPPAGTAGPARRPQRGPGPGRPARPGRQERDGRADDRPGLLRHHHPGRDPPQRGGGPGLVHRLHPVPAGDLAGPAGGAAELPDHGAGPHRAADRQRLAAGRSHRRGRGRAADAPLQQGQGRRQDRAGRGPAAADHRRGQGPGQGAGLRGGGGRPRRRAARGRHFRHRAAAAGRLRPRLRPRPGDRPGQGTRRHGHRGRRPAGPDPDHASGRAGRRHRRRQYPAFRRPAVLRRPARRLHGRAQGA